MAGRLEASWIRRCRKSTRFGEAHKKLFWIFCSRAGSFTSRIRQSTAKLCCCPVSQCQFIVPGNTWRACPVSWDPSAWVLEHRSSLQIDLSCPWIDTKQNKAVVLCRKSPLSRYLSHCNLQMAKRWLEALRMKRTPLVSGLLKQKVWNTHGFLQLKSSRTECAYLMCLAAHASMAASFWLPRNLFEMQKTWTCLAGHVFEELLTSLTFVIPNILLYIYDVIYCICM